MRIKSIKIAKLFGIFDHTIDMNLDERITIIYGLNGVGKTTVLRLLYSLFCNRLATIQTIPFASFEVECEDGRTIKVKRSAGPSPEQHPVAPLDITLHKNGKQIQEMKFRGVDARESRFPMSMVDDIVPMLIRTGEATWRNAETGEELTFTDVVGQYGDLFPSGLAPGQGIAKWLSEFTSSIKIRFIESQRLLKPGKRSRRPDGRWTQTGGYEPAVAFYAEHIAREISRKLAEYAELSQALDQTFPMRLVETIEKKQFESVSPVELEGRLTTLEDKRRRLREAGLLEKEDVPFRIPTALRDVAQQVLPLYVSDVVQKLEVFDQLLRKIELLKSIVQDRFSFKSIAISKEKGFTFTSALNEPLQATHLSSGEQHMLVLLSELLFTVEPNSLVMIDEPEISLHVAWQQSFLRDVKTTTELASFDILIATHSPQIVNENWDFTVALNPPEELRQ